MKFPVDGAVFECQFCSSELYPKMHVFAVFAYTALMLYCKCNLMCLGFCSFVIAAFAIWNIFPQHILTTATVG